MLQRKCACGSGKSLTGECDECRQRHTTSHGPAPTAGKASELPPIVGEVLRSAGQPLNTETRSFMEGHFGHDFSQVRVHADSKAAASTRAVDAAAYAVGSDIAFGAGRYAPGSVAGQKLIAHELAHVVQQGAPVSANRTPWNAAATDDTAERQAEAAAQAIIAGGPFSVSTGLPGGLARSPEVPTAKKGIGEAVYKLRFSQLGPLPMEYMLARLNELDRETLLDLRQHSEYGAAYGRERLEIAMDAVWHRNFSRAVLPEFRATLPSRMNQVIPFADQQRAVNQFLNAAAIERAKKRAEAAAPAPRAGAGQKTPSAGAGGAQGAIPAERLSPMGTDEQTTFKRQVYNTQMKNAMRAKTFFPGVPAEELAVVEKGQKMRKDAAQACRDLLAKAREDLKKQQDASDELAMKVSSVGVGSCYRDPQQDFGIWDGLFQKYYNETQAKRGELDGGEHGDKAVQYLAGYISQYKALPGFSNHTSGIAVDFITTEGKESLGADKSQNPRWKKSWLHAWLVEHASTFGFQPLATEAWHWDYKGTEAGQGRPDSG
ncbi:MAG: DUF4157 domain-containing protein [Terriglobia bacterium]